MSKGPAAEVGTPTVNDHPFMPRDPMEPWGLCVCGMAEAAHTSAAIAYMPRPSKPARVNGHDKEAA